MPDPISIATHPGYRAVLRPVPESAFARGDQVYLRASGEPGFIDFIGRGGEIHVRGYNGRHYSGLTAGALRRAGPDGDGPEAA